VNYVPLAGQEFSRGEGHVSPLVVEIIQMSPRWTWPQDRQAQEECSFLKKRGKKLLFSAVHFLGDSRQREKVFCFFFSKKKCLSCFFRHAAGQCGAPLA
jgi:hypothetical protein